MVLALASSRCTLTVRSPYLAGPNVFEVCTLPSMSVRFDSDTSYSMEGGLNDVTCWMGSPSMLKMMRFGWVTSRPDASAMNGFLLYSVSATPPENWDRRKITNSAGFTGATPISHTTMPASIDSAGLV